MSVGGHTGKTPSGWTVDTLHELLEVQTAHLHQELDGRLASMRRETEERHLAQDKGIAATFSAQQAAVSKAEVSTERRFESVNEFRGQLADQARTFMPRLEASALLAAMAEKLELVERRLERAEGKAAGRNATFSTIIAVIGGTGVLVSIATAIIVLTR